MEKHVKIPDLWFPSPCKKFWTNKSGARLGTPDFNTILTPQEFCFVASPHALEKTGLVI